MFKDFLYHTNVFDKKTIFNLRKKVNKLCTKKNIIDITQRSTRGKKSKQYNLYNQKEKLIDISNEIIKIFKEKITANATYNLISSWTVIGKENSWHSCHKHNTKINHLATVLYLDVPKKINTHQSGDFFYFLLKENNILEYNNIIPKLGDLIIMPIHIFHGAYPQSKGTRQTLNMDFEVIY
jgi:hypothetical protein